MFLCLKLPGKSTATIVHPFPLAWRVHGCCQAKMAVSSFLPRPWCLSCSDDGAVAVWALVALCCGCGTSSHQHPAVDIQSVLACFPPPEWRTLNYSCYCYPCHCFHARDNQKLCHQIWVRYSHCSLLGFNAAFECRSLKPQWE